MHWKLDETITTKNLKRLDRHMLFWLDTHQYLLHRKRSCSFYYFLTVYSSIQLYAVDKVLDFLLQYELLNFILAAGIFVCICSHAGALICCIKGQHGLGFSLHTCIFFWKCCLYNFMEEAHHGSERYQDFLSLEKPKKDIMMKDAV